MNPETPKIVAAWLDWYGNHYMLSDAGIAWAERRLAADARLAESGQRAIWPDGHGVAVIEDIPKPEPLPTAYCYRTDWDRLVWDNAESMPSWPLVATVTFDEDGNAHVERVVS